MLVFRIVMQTWGKKNTAIIIIVYGSNQVWGRQVLQLILQV